jgi:hypothetical protein
MIIIVTKPKVCGLLCLKDILFFNTFYTLLKIHTKQTPGYSRVKSAVGASGQVPDIHGSIYLLIIISKHKIVPSPP